VFVKLKEKVEKLVKKAKKRISLDANIGIGHTRWATHGEPNDINAHPLVSNNGSLVIVHNGIIENYATIKNELISKGYDFKSETDTEVLVNLIEYVQMTENVKLGKAVQLALSQVVGAYAIAVFDEKKSDEIVVARLGSPLAIGIGER
jgi:glucosamine--fructose-6-phosphate aminotransferase (isomerizing)